VQIEEIKEEVAFFDNSTGKILIADDQPMSIMTLKNFL